MKMINRAYIDFSDELKTHALDKKATDFISSDHNDLKKVKFVSNNKKTLWRYQTLYSKEPATITWMQSLGEGDVLWDVGANVGIYSIFAALVGRARVVAFEPGAANYWIINENIRVNGLQDHIRAMCVALSDKTTFDMLHMQSTSAGATLNQTKQAIDDTGTPFKAKFLQGVFLARADDLVEHYGIEPPTAIKIDVDGAELDVLAGAPNVLANRTLRKVSLELNCRDEKTVGTATASMTRHGFELIGSYGSPFVNAEDTAIKNYHFIRP